MKKPDIHHILYYESASYSSSNCEFKHYMFTFGAEEHFLGMIIMYFLPNILPILDIGQAALPKRIFKGLQNIKFKHVFFLFVNRNNLLILAQKKNFASKNTIPSKIGFQIQPWSLTGITALERQFLSQRNITYFEHYQRFKCITQIISSAESNMIALNNIN